MNTNIYKIAFFTAVTAFLFVACEKKEHLNEVVTDRDFSQEAQLKVFNASVGTARNFVYLDGKPLNYATIGYNTSFPIAASNYAALLQPGSKTVLIRDTSSTATTQPPITFTQNFEAGKFYTLYTYDTVGAIKYKIVPSQVPSETDMTIRVRLAHFAFLRSATSPAIDVFSKNKNANIFSNVSFGNVSDFITYTTGSDSLIVRQAGSTTINLDTAVFTPTVKRSYTLIFGGRYMTNEAGGAVSPRSLTTSINY